MDPRQCEWRRPFIVADRVVDDGHGPETRNAGLDLGCGRASSSIFLHREFGVEVWATDLWFSASENIQRIQDADVEGHVFPIHADAHSLPFAAEFFDAILSIDSFVYYGTDDLYLNYL